jgi:hypothetical protein
VKKVIVIIILSLALVGFTFIGFHDAEAEIYLNAIAMNAIELNSIKFNTIGFKDISSNAKQLKVLKAKDFDSNGLCLNGIILAGD